MRGKKVNVDALSSGSLDRGRAFSHDNPGMDCPRISRSYLESLNAQDLARLAEDFGLEIPSGLERVFIIEELLDMALAGEGRKGEASPLREAAYLEPVPLPKRYNITFIDVIIRDPLWAFVFWEVKGQDREFFEKSPDFSGYRLRVSSVLDGGGGEEVFTVPVGVDDGAWYLGFPAAGGRYTVSLRAVRARDETILAVSRPFRLPDLFAFSPEEVKPLVRLSGAEDLRVFRHVDRLSRPLNRSLPQAAGDA